MVAPEFLLIEPAHIDFMDFMRRLFAPSRARLVLFGVFVVIAILGQLQAAGFSEEGGRSGGMFHAIPIWEVWMYLLAPLGFLFLALDQTGLELHQTVFSGPAVVFWAVQVIYFYVVACLLAAAGEALQRKRATTDDRR